MLKKRLFIRLTVVLLALLPAAGGTILAQTISLAGQWNFKTDPADAGNPVVKIEVALIDDLVNKPSKFVFNAFTKATPDELKPKTAAQ